MSNSLGPLSRRALVLLVLLGLMAAMASQAAAAKKGNPADRSRVEFAGYVWDVKSSNGLVGPGPNVFSDRNVRVDRRGDLHLQIRERRGQWTSAEV
ncbi:MAG: hypothetical protein OEM67_04790, partial [Thermoleophilia bacterium]|nr:hypothetical protein [Thermoleophilia bacterium]